MPQQQYKNWIFYFAFVCIGWISINFAQTPVGLENKVYLANVVSIVEDFDLNIINNVPKESRWIVSGTYNYPDMHFDGETVLHFPEAVIARLVKPFFREPIQYGLGEDNTFLFAMCISTMTFFFIALNFLAKLFYRKGDLLSNFILVTVLLSSPILYWTFSDYSSTDSLCFFISSLILYFLLRSEFKQNKDFFIWGSLLGFGLVLKPSFLFYVPLFALYLFKKNRSFKNLLAFFMPVFIFIVCKYLNSFLRFGYPTYFSGYEYSYNYDVKSIFTFLRNYIIGPFGIIHQAPWLLIVLLLSLSSKKLLKNNLLLTGIFIAVFSKLLYEIMCLCNAETEFGFRRFIIDLPFLLYFLSVALNQYSLKTKKVLASLFSITTIYMIIYWIWYRNIDSLSPSPIGVYKLWEYFPVHISIQDLVQFLARFNFIKYSSAFALVFIFASINFILLHFLKRKISFKILSIGLISLYSFFTVLNITHNKANVETLKKENFFSQMVVSNNKNVFLYDEFFSEVGRDLLIAKFKKDSESFNFSKKTALSFIDSLNEEVIVDPINFKKLNSEHKIKPITYLSDAITTDSIFNFNSKTKFDEIFNK